MVAVASAPMRRAFAWMTGLVGVAALARLLRRRQGESPKPAEPSIDDPAAELREALARSRPPETPEPRAPEEQPETSLEERRARVHARAQETIESMRLPPEDPEEA